MRKCSIDVIKSTIAAIELHGIGAVDRLGKKIKEISSNTIKYDAVILDIDYFIVFDQARSVKEISFVSNSCEFDLADVEKEFGVSKINYNFRENYSEFNINIPSNNVIELFFIKYNKFQVIGTRQFVETTPQGQESTHARLDFNGFCLRLRS
jgi:hypothetical protein